MSELTPFRQAIGEGWIIGRATCPDCHVTRAYVKHLDVEELRCPTCDAVCVPAHQEES